jgi:hypothetical protein
VNADPSKITYRPAVFLGIGGLGGHILSCLRRRLTERLGDASSVPALRLLYIDTDAQAISASRATDDSPGFQHDETLLIPLREPSAYRKDSAAHLQWLSRRWLFNIPRSRRVEGIRPLGRLAFVDHHQEIRARVGQMIDEVTSEEALQQSHRTTGLRFAAGPPDVVLVAAISGGTGSGAVLDAAYLTRALLAERELEPADLSGLLLHATSPQGQTRQLEVANTVACLSEFEHFISPHGGYPGDPTCQLPRFDVGPFDHAYVVHLGDGPTPAGLATEADRIAEYLYRSTTTPARAFFQECRLGKETDTRPGEPAAGLRTFGVAQLGDDIQAEALGKAEILCRALVRQWRGHLDISPEGRPATTPEAGQLSTATLSRFRLTAEDMGTLATSMTQGQIGKRIEAYFHTRWAHLRASRAGSTHAADSLVEVLDRDFLPESQEVNQADHPSVILQHLQQQLQTSAQKCVFAIQTDLLTSIDTHATRLDAGREALGDIVFRLDATLDRLLPLLKRIRSDLEQIRLTATHDTSASNEPYMCPTHPTGVASDESRALYQRYYLLKFCEGIWRCSIEYVRTIRDNVSKTAIVFASLDEQLQRLEDRFARVPSANEIEHPADTPSAISSPAPSVIKAFDHQLRTEGNVKLAELISPEPQSTLEALAGLLRNAAVGFLAERGDDPHAVATNTGNIIDQEQGFVEAVTPRISFAGGGRRILAVLPGQTPPRTWQQKLADKFGSCVTIQQHACRDVFACCEVEGLAVRSVVGGLTCDQPTVVDMAFRLHSRVDVEWDPG